MVPSVESVFLCQVHSLEGLFFWYQVPLIVVYSLEAVFVFVAGSVNRSVFVRGRICFCVRFR